MTDDEKLLRMQILVNEMLPAQMRCDDAIASMRARLEAIRRRKKRSATIIPLPQREGQQ